MKTVVKLTLKADIAGGRVLYQVDPAENVPLEESVSCNWCFYPCAGLCFFQIEFRSRPGPGIL